MKTSSLSLIAMIVMVGSIRWLYSFVMSKATADRSSCVALVGSSLTEKDGQSYIGGSIRNNCDSKFGQVTILFKLDRDGVAYAYSRDVEPGETRTFKTAIPVSRNAGYRFDRINAF
jgi:hypothetical protein